MFEVLEWPTHGWVREFDPQKGVLTYLPVHAFVGTDSVLYRARDETGAGPVATVRILVQSFPDSDKDGMSDLWEYQHDVNNPTADGDADGQANGQEFLAWTDPRDPGSVLKILAIGLDRTNNRIAVSWKSVGGVRYRLQYADRPGGEFKDMQRSPLTEIDAEAPGQPSNMTAFDDWAPAPAHRFYRVQVVQ